MTDVLAVSSRELFDDLAAECGISATISRGATSVSATVVRALTGGEALTTRETIVSADMQDILMLADDYGALSEPQSGDRIEYVNARGQTVSLDVRPRGQTEKPFIVWRGDEVMRVHCKVAERA